MNGKLKRIVELVLLMTLFSCSSPQKEIEKSKPNIIVILVDDLGYNDLGCYNAQDKYIQTPNIDQLATEGMRFTDWQSANSICAPSRASILTGRYPPRNGYVVVSHPFDREQYEHLGLYQDEVTIAEILKPLGYITAAVGKWHMGEHYDYRPLRHGFDEYYGRMHNFHLSQKGAIYEGDSLTGDSVLYQEAHRLITVRAKEFLSRASQENTPFFLYLSHYLVHGPWKPNRRFATENEWEKMLEVNGHIHNEVYPAMVRELDWHIGEIVNELDKLGMTDNTILFFTSDNGPWLTQDSVRSAGSAWPLRGSKFNTFEGGDRVPAIVKYPGKIPAGRVSNELVSSMDIFPTIAHLTGAQLPADRIIDGKNIWPILADQKDAESPHKVLYAYHGKNLQTIRKGSWKLHLPRSPEAVPFYGQRGWGRGTIDSLVTPMLFNLDQDLGEQVDVSDQYPSVVEELLREAEAARLELGDWNIKGKKEHDLNGFKGDIHARP